MSCFIRFLWFGSVAEREYICARLCISYAAYSNLDGYNPYMCCDKEFDKLSSIHEVYEPIFLHRFIRRQEQCVFDSQFHISPIGKEKKKRCFTFTPKNAQTALCCASNLITRH